jgi:hypothetical protein
MMPEGAYAAMPMPCRGNGAEGPTVAHTSPHARVSRIPDDERLLHKTSRVWAGV